MATLSAREFNHDVSAAKRAADDEPVIITDRGAPAYVLLSIEEYRHLSGENRNIRDWLRMDDDVDFEPARLNVEPKVPEL
jgi:prevent-host-death family protein